MSPLVPVARCTNAGPHMVLKKGSDGKHGGDVGVLVVEVEVEHMVTGCLHAENLLKVVAGESPGIGDVAQARTVVNQDAVLSVRPESEEANIFLTIIGGDGPVLEPAADLVNPFSPTRQTRPGLSCS